MKKPALHKKLSEFYEWLFRPEKFWGLSRNGPQFTQVTFILLHHSLRRTNDVKCSSICCNKAWHCEINFLVFSPTPKKESPSYQIDTTGCNLHTQWEVLLCRNMDLTLIFNVTATIKLLYLGFWLSFLHIVTANLHSGSKHSFGKFGDWDSKQMANFLGNCEKTYSMNPTRKPENIRHNLLFKCQT